jgi:chromate transporter
MPIPRKPVGDAGAVPSLPALLRYFFTLGSLGFGGPIALANHIRRDLVEKRGWLTEEEYDDGLAIAAACPGPLVFQLAIYCGYLRFGVLGGVSVAFVFALTPFLVVVTIAHFYSRFAATWQLRGLFYGIAPVVVALILRACWHLGSKTLRRDPAAWIFFVATLGLTVILQRELTATFLVAGILGMFVFPPGRPPRPEGRPPDRPAAEPSGEKTALPAVVAALPWAGINARLFFFFFKAGLFMFGSGLVIIPFLKTYVVDQYHWATNRQFLDAVAIGLISPGPVAVAATFIAYLMNGFSGAVAATVGMFSPSVLFTVVAAPILLRYRENPRLQGFIQGVKVAVVGVLVGTTLLVGKTAIGDLFTIALAVATVALLARWEKIPEPLVVAVGALIGLAAYAWLRPEWLLR